MRFVYNTQLNYVKRPVIKRLMNQYTMKLDP